ncbi:Type III-B CRISPR module RAMP protein Cmr4 [Nitrospira tepida]|uniref:Type III-B CRISPR module RAMP protein Cmr4 n=1 Tax=Nitrospira tepida TaxID=2973512 RepID=A0AA86MY87_9BACT|nr:type III-B CRISPR module RAMP protein Cmr4 [Nitrospira tepida]CAI4031138.1 Type III-B CRISPR module RAMP protein Cmr4 [Nitrospira tepida]
MAKLAIPLFLYTETPLHPGTGAQVGTVDLPIQRERYTDYPIIQGSSLKGVFRSLARECNWQSDEIAAMFGPETGEADKHAGAISFTDARILLFPVRAIGTVFAWTTCPHVLARLRRDLTHCGLDGLPNVPAPPAKDGALVPTGSALLSGSAQQGPIILEEFSYTAEANQDIKQLGDWLSRQLFTNDAAFGFWKTKLAADLVVLPDNEFREFAKTATEIVTRVRLDENTKTVQPGALWTEEHVPSDSAFCALVLLQDPMADNKQASWTAAWVSQKIKTFDGQRIQVGGDETTGRGFALVRFGGGNDGKAR